MKKLIFILSIFLFSSAVYAQDVPQNVITAFSTKYPNTTVRKWKTDKDGFTAEFKIDKSKYTAVFSTNGDWVRTEKRVHWTWNLPEPVNKALKTGDYAAWYVEKINYVETPSQRNYVLRINNKALLPSHEINIFRETRLLYYNEKGELVDNHKI